MPRKRVLIVDDQHEVRRMLHAWMETLRPAVDVVSVPSGEEAFLEAARNPIDLMVSDVRLPGITGLELFEKIRKRRPALKVILITGMTDPVVRKQVADAGAFAFFMKPIDMPDFLDAAERALGLVETSFPAAPIAVPEKHIPSLDERLHVLRSELNADGVLVVDAQGKVIDHTGIIPDVMPGSQLLLALLGSFHAGVKVSTMLGSKTDLAITYFKSARHDLVLAQLGSDHFLLAAAPIDPTKVIPEGMGLIIFESISRLQQSLSRLAAESAPARLDGEAAAAEEPEPEGEPVSEEAPAAEPVQAVEVPLTAEEISNLEAIFEAENGKPAQEVDLESFWDSAVEESGGKTPGSGSVLSFEEAKRLGLAPGEGKA